MRLITVAAALTVVLVAASGCGGSKKSSTPPAVTTTTTTTTTTSTSTSSSSSDKNTITGKCVEFAGLAQKFSQAFSSTGSSAPNGAELKSYFDALADKAPSDIKSSFKTFADAFATYIDTIKGLNVKPGKVPSAKDLAKLQAAVQALEKPEVKAASDKIQAWVQGGCK